MAQKKRKTGAWNTEWDWAKVEDWMKSNAHATYQEFKAVYPKYPYTDSAYYAMRRKVNDPSLYNDSYRPKSHKSTLYKIMGTLDRDAVEKASPMDAMKMLLEIIERHTAVGVQIVELKDPPSIEIRQFTRP